MACLDFQWCANSQHRVFSLRSPPSALYQTKPQASDTGTHLRLRLTTLTTYSPPTSIYFSFWEVKYMAVDHQNKKSLNNQSQLF